MGLKDIYIIDHRVVGPEGQSAADTILDQLPSSDDIVGVAALPSMSIAGLIQSILVDSLGVSGDHPPRDVRSIRIMAHGQVGALQLGTGLNGSAARDLSPLSEVLISPSPRSNPPPSPGTVLGWNQIAPSDHGFCHIFGCNLATAVPPTEPGIMHIERGSLCAPGYLGEDAIRFGTGFHLLT